jgi:predicted nucleotidyltransferase
MNTASFEKVIDVLNGMQKANVIEKYAIGGAFAATLHNEPISTIDLDIFFFLNEKSDSPILSLSKIYDFAGENGFTFDHEFINIHGWLVQFVEASHNDLCKESIENADIIKIGNFEVSVIGREHLVAMWLFAGRIKDFEKISKFCEAEILDETKLFDVLERRFIDE